LFAHIEALCGKPREILQSIAKKIQLYLRLSPSVARGSNALMGANEALLLSLARKLNSFLVAYSYAIIKIKNLISYDRSIKQ